MTNERARANTPGLTRRNLLAALPVSGAALAISTTTASADPDPAILAALAELETPQGWEASSVVAARVFAAYLIRDALGMEIPPKVQGYAADHLHFQNRMFEGYQRTAHYERDIREGKIMPAPRVEL